GNVILSNKGDGVLIEFPNSAGLTTVQGNLISRNLGDGVHLTFTGAAPTTPGSALIEQNFIGTNLAGTSTVDLTGLSFGNGQNGIELDGVNATVQKNVISGNGISGISIGRSLAAGPGSTPRNSDLSDTTIFQNRIGTDKTGTFTATPPSDKSSPPNSALGNVL